MIRSRQVNEELQLFTHIIGLMGGLKGANQSPGNQIAIHNLHSDPDNSGSSPPIIKTLGLREAILNSDQIQDTPYFDASTYVGKTEAQGSRRPLLRNPAE